MQVTGQSTAIIGGAIGWGAQRRETEKGPAALQEFNLVEKLKDRGISAYWQSTIFPRTSALGASAASVSADGAFPEIFDHAQRLYKEVIRCLEKGDFPFIIGGDQTVTASAFSAAIVGLKAQQKFGFLLVDAHMDSHTPETSPSQAYHGMPLACLLGYGVPEWLNLGKAGPKLHPAHVALVGTRSYESGEAELLDRLGVRIFKMSEVHQRGIQAVMQEALKIISEKTTHFGLSIDLDAFDPSEAPGVGSPEPDGLKGQEFLQTLKNFASHPKFSLLEIVEYNPDRDKNNKTAQLVVELAGHLLGGKL